MEGYKATLEFCSKELTAKERIQLKDTGNAIRLDEATKDGASIVIKPAFYAVLGIDNPMSESKNYKNYIVVDTDGKKYVTGSDTFYDTFSDIMSDMEGSDEDFAIEIYSKESSNYKGKYFITCSII